MVERHAGISMLINISISIRVLGVTYWLGLFPRLGGLVVPNIVIFARII